MFHYFSISSSQHLTLVHDGCEKRKGAGDDVIRDCFSAWIGPQGHSNRVENEFLGTSIKHNVYFFLKILKIKIWFIWVQYDKYNRKRKTTSIDHVNSHIFGLKTEERSLGTWKNGRWLLIKSTTKVKVNYWPGHFYFSLMQNSLPYK